MRGVKLQSVVIYSLLLAACTAYASQSVALDEADLLITNGTVVSMNESNTIFRDGVVAIKGDTIVAVGSSELLEQYHAKTLLDVGGDIVMPGLINTHTHLSMTVFRSLGEDVSDRLHKFIFPLEAHFVDAEMVRLGAMLGAIEQIKGGTTTLADMYYFMPEVANVIDRTGLRAVLGATVLSNPTPDAKTPAVAIKNALEFVEKYQNHSRITPAFAPHGPYTNDTETLQTIARLSNDKEIPVLIHLAESQREVDVIKARSGLSPVAYMHEIGALNRHMTAAHVIRVDDNDLQLLQDADVGIAHNMSANIKSAKGVAPVLDMNARNLRVGLGTDGPMSGNTLSIIDELDQVAKVHKLISGDREAMPVKTVVRMATIGGARALHMEEKIGSLEVGKLADIVVISTQSPNMVPVYDVYAALVYSAYASDVRHSIVNGKIIMRDRVVLQVDEKVTINKVQDYAQKIAGFIRPLQSVNE